MEKETLYAIGIVLMFAVYVVERLVAQRSIKTLTAALVEAKSDPALIEQGHKLAVDVVSVDLLRQALTALTAIAPLVKTVTPDDVDAAIDAGTDLAKAVVDGVPPYHAPDGTAVG